MKAYHERGDYSRCEVDIVDLDVSMRGDSTGSKGSVGVEEKLWVVETSKTRMAYKHLAKITRLMMMLMEKETRL